MQQLSNNNDSPWQPVRDGPSERKEANNQITVKKMEYNDNKPSCLGEAEQHDSKAEWSTEPRKASSDLIGARKEGTIANTTGQAELQSAGEELAELQYNIRSNRLARQSIREQFTRLKEKLDRFGAIYVDTDGGSMQQTPAERQTAIPELKLLPWKQYVDGVHRGRNLKNDVERLEKEHSAIDVLLGEPEFWWDKEKSETETAATIAAQLGEVRSEAGIMPPNPQHLRPLPDRIRLNSRPLISILDDLVDDSEPSPEILWAFRKPYKLLLCYESELRQIRDKMRQRWGQSSDSIDHKSSEPQASEASSSSGRVILATKEKVRHGAPRVSTRSSLRDSAEALRDLECLIKFIDEYLNPRVERYQKLNHPKIRFDDLWYLFSPGDYIISRQNPSKAWRILLTFGGRLNLATRESLARDTEPPPKHEVNPFTIHCCYLDFDGKYFREVHESFKIEHFDIEKKVTSLKVFPLRYHDNPEMLRKDLVERGRKFLKCIEKPQLRYFSGRTLNHTWKGKPLKNRTGDPVRTEDVEAQVIIDMDRALRINNDWAPNWGESDVCTGHEPDERETIQRLNHHCDGQDWCMEDISPDSWLDNKRREDIILANPRLAKKGLKSLDVSEEDMLILSGHIFGFILRSRKWACFPLDDLREVQPSKRGFEDLQLRDEGHKGIIQALVKTHLDHKPKKGTSCGLDLVDGKGEGLVILLHGSPGVGKTSTAECIADYTGKPLLPITSGDLGVRAETVQDTLDENFQLAQAWDCILLLDEADVFLSSRDKTNLESNALVSVFLRTLEYYKGILFLTTNRVGGIDEAVKSRIRVSLHYPALSLQQALSIWDLNLARTLESRATTLQADEKQRERLKTWACTNLQDSTGTIIWNGRQIRNAFSTAAALAEFETPGIANGQKASLEIRFFEIVMKATKAFDQYLLDTRHGRTDEDLLAMAKIRSREIGQGSMSSGMPAGMTQMGPTSQMGGLAMQHVYGNQSAAFPNSAQTSFLPQTAASNPFSTAAGQTSPFSNNHFSQQPGTGQGMELAFHRPTAAQPLQQYQQQSHYDPNAQGSFQSPTKPPYFAEPVSDASQTMSLGQAAPGLPVTPMTPSYNLQMRERDQIMQNVISTPVTHASPQSTLFNRPN